MKTWNLADVWETIADVRPGAPAIIQGASDLTWQQFDQRANSLAHALVSSGLSSQAKVAQYLYNCPEYLESFYGALKAGLTPVNTNFRYNGNELLYVWNNCDAEAVVFDARFAGMVEPIRARLPNVRLWICVGDNEVRPDWAIDYEAIANEQSARIERARSGDDLVLIYTGGTTGLPKGVMWRQDDLFTILNRTGEMRYAEERGVIGVRMTLAGDTRYGPPRLIPATPLMHGTGLFTALSVLNSAGSVTLLESRSLSIVELLDTIERQRATQLTIAGDSVARPLVTVLDAEPHRWDISSLWLIVSSGTTWSSDVKLGLMRHQPALRLVDSLSSSETGSMARAQWSGADGLPTNGFQLGPDARVLSDDGSEVRPGSSIVGTIAIRGRGPIGYYKDVDSSNATFRLINGERWIFGGDLATVAVDGSVQLRGRRSMSINTGGEKVYPLEVEDALKQHPMVADAVVIGAPHERLGEQVVALVELTSDAIISKDSLIEWIKTSVASFKAPRRIYFVPTIERGPTGKIDYDAVKAVLAAGVNDVNSPLGISGAD